MVDLILPPETTDTLDSPNRIRGRHSQGGMGRSPTVNPLFLTDQELRQGIEMLYFAYRDFVTEPDEILANEGLGRAHHRAIYFVGRHPMLSVSELLAILKITKQSFNRVLNDLLNRGLVAQDVGSQDRRQRLLCLTDAGKSFEAKLTQTQMVRFAKAYKRVGAQAVDGFRQVLLSLMEEEIDRQRFPHPKISKLG